MADLERDMLIQDETALLLDIAASVESRGCCTYPSSFGVCDGGGCSATFRSGASTIISCRQDFEAPDDLDRLCNFAYYLYLKRVGSKHP